MIKATDLRIGDIVFVDNEKHHPLLKDVPLEVTGISETTLGGEWTYSISLKHINQQPNRYYESYSQFIKFIRPIALTPEVLEKAGFEKRKNWEGMWTVVNKKKTSSFTVMQRKDGVFITNETKEPTLLLSVHHLQNLYYALKNEELTLNLCTVTTQNGDL